MSLLQNLRSILLNTFLWILLILLYGPLVILLSGWRYLVNFLVVNFVDPDLTPCSPNDTLLVHETPKRQPILTGGFCLKVKGVIDADKLCNLFEELFLTTWNNNDANNNYGNYANLYCDLVKVCGYLFKRKIVQRVKLEKQVEIRELKNGEDFKVVMSSWFQQRFERGLPLWQMLVLNGSSGQVQGQGQGQDELPVYSYFAFKAHHVLMDGYSLVHVLDKLTGVTSPSPGEWSNATSKSDSEKVESSKNSNKKSLWTELKILFTLPEVVANFTFPNVSWNPSGEKFPESRSLSHFEMLPLSCGTCDLEPIREIRRKLNVHFPAIVYGLQAGVIRASLLEGVGTPGNVPISENNLPQSILICSSLPVLGVEHPRSKLTNHWSGGYIKVPLSPSSAKFRVEQANQSLEKILQDEGTYIIWKYLAWVLWLIPAWVHCLLDKCSWLHLCKYRSSMSCIPQSCTVQYNLMGLPVQNIFHAPVMKDSFLSAVLLGCSSSHHDQVDFSLFGHPEWFPDQEKMNRAMGAYLRQELENLAAECGVDTKRLQWRLS